ncbi:transposase [Clostridium oryzae]|uniref:Transposase IS200 like protein n=1 Tax=Clostridium oryzae TaxID=1450648 RepID=A0A1V4IHC3_9CLOT|nr:transposase [Clostridium oryzae]OPJ59326.1 transposase IS200 like protein [Clostridium oryzae]
MPRGARIKNPQSTFHIMVKSISEINLFRNSEDKDMYLYLLNKYQKIFVFKVYAYCLMSNHAHIIIDCCGADISKIMKSINQCYAIYYNSKYKRHGHLFQDRFKSKIVTDNKYLLALSLYIHNNPKDIIEFKNCIEKYPYSSLGIFLGIAYNRYEIVDTNFILALLDEQKRNSIKKYSYMLKLENSSYILHNVEFETHSTNYNRRDVYLRDFDPDDIIQLISQITGSYINVHLKYIRKNTEQKSICAIVLHSLCNFRHKDICSYFGNSSEASISRLCKTGFNLISNNDKYKNIISSILASTKSA